MVAANKKIVRVKFIAELDRAASCREAVAKRVHRIFYEA